MPVIGTAGHVDHGKSALIEALTGTNPDRLPEEKARGMTIDLGFAFFGDDVGRPVGVIDVPGHERYIRNMVAGAAGIDAALLVVAADDGWMDQTERHSLVLKALGVPIVAIALTKIDLVPQSRVEEIAADTALRSAATFDSDIPLVQVSSKTGLNIELLRRTILNGLALLPARETGGAPWLSIDRVFTLKGTGLIVAGSLVGGVLARGDELFLHPGKEVVRVRTLQSYGRELESADPGDRVALNVPRPKRDILRGDCLASAKAPLSSGVELVCQLRELVAREGPEVRQKALRNGLEIEVAVGTARRLAEVRTMRSAGFLRLVLDAPVPCIPGQRILLIRHGGADILGAATILDSGSYTALQRRLIAAACGSLGKPPGSESPELFQAALRGAASPSAKAPGKPAPDSSLAPPRTTAASEGPSPSALAILKRIEAAGPAGLERTAALEAKVKKEIGPLCDAGLLVPIDTDIFVTTAVYHRLVDSILAGKKPGDRFGVPEAKAATGYSRKYALPFLNRMERDGWLKRDGDDRVVLRIVI